MMRKPLVILGAAVLAILVAVVFSVPLLSRDGDAERPAEAVLPALFGAPPTLPAWMVPWGRGDWDGSVRLPPASGADAVRVRVPSVGIDAEVITGYVDEAANQMIAPDSPWVVAWYRYSPPPGTGGNTVLAGHVDYVNVGPAVFWRLRELDSGDRVTVELADGETLTYEVQFNEVYSAAGGPWDSLFGPYADEDVITLYTCDGVFEGGEYSDRRVVRAFRVS